MIEEVSHFRFLVNRATYNQQVSKLQLEFQAELDKILVATTLFRTKSSSFNLSNLYHLCFNRSYFVNVEASQLNTYIRASQYASRFWYEFRKSGLTEKSLHRSK